MVVPRIHITRAKVGKPDDWPVVAWRPGLGTNATPRKHMYPSAVVALVLSCLVRYGNYLPCPVLWSNMKTIVESMPKTWICRSQSNLAVYKAAVSHASSMHAEERADKKKKLRRDRRATIGS